MQGKTLHIETDRWTVFFRKKLWEFEFKRVEPGAAAAPFFVWWLKIGPVCVFRLAAKRAEVDKIKEIRFKSE